MNIEHIMHGEYTDVRDYGKKLDPPVTARRVRRYCEEKRVACFKVGGKWFIRKDSPDPRGKVEIPEKD